MCIAGEKLFKLYRYTEGNLKQFAFMKTEPSHYLCLAWISEDRLLLGTDHGKVQLFEVGELKNEFSLSGKAGNEGKPGSNMQSPAETSRKS